MDEISLKARAKININLDIVGRRKDGYHFLNMIMQQIDLFDDVFVKKASRGISVSTASKYVRDDKTNIAYKAAYEMMQLFDDIKGVAIEIDKKIPVAAGLAGGSADGAAVILGLNKIYNLKLSESELIDIGLKVGADVPFCLIGGCAAVSGIGEIVKPIKGLTDKWVVISKPPIGVSTKEVYSLFKLENIRRDFDFGEIIEAVESQNVKKFSSIMNNSLESVTAGKYKEVRELKRKFEDSSPNFCMMSGSGPTVFGIYDDYENAKKGYTSIKKYAKDTYLVKTYNNLNGGYYGE